MGIKELLVMGGALFSMHFGIIVVQGIRNAGIEEKAVNKNLIKIGIIGRQSSNPLKSRDLRTSAI